jgi:hypothetical protein
MNGSGNMTNDATKVEDRGLKQRAVLILAGELVVGPLVMAYLWWSRDQEFESIGARTAATAVVLGFMALVFAGLIEGARLARAGRHRNLGICTATVSAIPILFWCALAMGAFDNTTRTDARVANWPGHYEGLAWIEERRKMTQHEKYETVERVFKNPQPLQHSYVEDDQIVLVFADSLGGRSDSLEVHLVMFDDRDAFSRYCNQSLVGEKITVEIPMEQSYWWEPFVTVSYQGKKVSTHLREVAHASR